jgi:hypothetical protein
MASDLDAAAADGCASGIPEQAHPFGWVHLVEHATQELPQPQLPLHTMQQPVEPSWQPAKPVASVAGVSHPTTAMQRPIRRVMTPL